MHRIKHRPMDLALRTTWELMESNRRVSKAEIPCSHQRHIVLRLREPDMAVMGKCRIHGGTIGDIALVSFHQSSDLRLGQARQQISEGASGGMRVRSGADSH